MQTFQQLLSALGPTAAGYINNPFGNPFMQAQQQMGTSNARNQNQTNTSGLVQNMTGSGMAGGASNPAATEMLQNQARAGTSNTAQQGFLAPLQNALGLQQNSMGIASGFRPLQTGGNTTQSTGGLGTWLPQVASAGLGALGTALGAGAGGNPYAGFGGGTIGGSLPTGNLGGLTGASPFAGSNGGFFGGGGGGNPIGGQGGYGFGGIGGLPTPPAPPGSQGPQ